MTEFTAADTSNFAFGFVKSTNTIYEFINGTWVKFAAIADVTLIKGEKGD